MVLLGIVDKRSHKNSFKVLDLHLIKHTSNLIHDFMNLVLKLKLFVS